MLLLRHQTAIDLDVEQWQKCRGVWGRGGYMRLATLFRKITSFSSVTILAINNSNEIKNGPETNCNLPPHF